MAQEMRDWSELQHDLLVLIGRRFNLIEDYLNFGTVCKSWHSAATKNNFNSELPRVPWLMLPEEEEEDKSDSCCRKFFSLYNGMILKKRILKASGKRCMECMGWLITVGKDEGEASLLHPCSVRITTEDFYEHETGYPFTFFRKAVLSASPSYTSDFVLMVIEGVDYSGRVLFCDVAGPEPTKRSHIIAQLPFDCRDRLGHPYIVESLGSLFIVVRHGVQICKVKDDCDRMRIPLTYIVSENQEELRDGEELRYGTESFRVFKVDLAAAGKVTETRELGERAFFLGANASLSVQASQFPGIKPNHVYFTDDFFESYAAFVEGGGLDMGVFNLADGSIQMHYEGVSLSRVCPPTWVTPTLC
ncbi:PREDICTED: putative F-box protein At1g65770 [Nicotiana attenuata]|uniref:putative F-box protein At1g65770 n=1 Tax=Nicotiana attenuata TaxID=49451 RepID=UPI000905AE69|nr:PREDICTED: putative F-box protein At1g65770 [Nicotiana attenuata]